MNEKISFYIQKGKRNVARGDLEDAIADFNWALKLDPCSLQALAARGNAKELADAIDGAVEDYNKILELDPQNTEALYRRGVCKYISGELQNSIVDFTDVLRLSSNNAVAWCSRGDAWFALGVWQEAVNDYSQSLRLDPGNVPTLLKRASASLEMADMEGAVNDCTLILRVRPQHRRAQKMIRRLRTLQGTEAKSKAAMQVALRQNGDILDRVRHASSFVDATTWQGLVRISAWAIILLWICFATVGRLSWRPYLFSRLPGLRCAKALFSANGSSFSRSSRDRPSRAELALRQWEMTRQSLKMFRTVALAQRTTTTPIITKTLKLPTSSSVSPPIASSKTTTTSRAVAEAIMVASVPARLPSTSKIVTKSAGEKCFLHFSNVLLAVVHAYFHASEVIGNYRKHFWDVIYLSPRADVKEFAQHGLASDLCDRWYPDQGVWDFSSWPCLGRVLGHLSGVKPIIPPPSWDGILRQNGRHLLTGALYLQADFWISPSFGAGFDLSKVWFLKLWASRQGDPQLKTWNWVGNGGPPQRPLRDAAATLLQSVSAFARLNRSKYYVAWADLFFLPRRVWSSWILATEKIGKFRIMNEIGIALAWQAMGVIEDGSLNIQKSATPCWGSPFSQATPTVVMQNPCGHKMDLRDEYLRKAVENLWETQDFCLRDSKTP